MGIVGGRLGIFILVFEEMINFFLEEDSFFDFFRVEDSKARLLR